MRPATWRSIRTCVAPPQTRSTPTSGAAGSKAAGPPTGLVPPINAPFTAGWTGPGATRSPTSSAFDTPRATQPPSATPPPGFPCQPQQRHAPASRRPAARTAQPAVRQPSRRLAAPPLRTLQRRRNHPHASPTAVSRPPRPDGPLRRPARRRPPVPTEAGCQRIIRRRWASPPRSRHRTRQQPRKADHAGRPRKPRAKPQR